MNKFLPLLLLVCFFSGCNDEIEDLTRVDGTRYRAEFAVPLIDSRVSLADLIGDVDDDVSLSIDPDGLLRFRYSGIVPAVSSDVIFAQLEPLTQGILVFITEQRQSVPFVLPDDLDLRELRVKDGGLQYNLTNTYDRPVNVELSIPTATIGGEVFRVTGTLPAYDGSGAPPTLTNAGDAIDLKGSVLDLNSDSLYLEYHIVDMDGNELDPSPQTLVAFTELKFSYVEGYLGQAEYPGEQDRIEVDFFDRYLSGDIFFVDPVITMTLTNSFGVPSRAVVELLNVITVDGEVLPVTGSAVTNGFDFDYPLVPGESATTTFVFDKENSNIDEILSSQPVALDYKISAIINPDANTSIIGFLTDSSAYSATIDVELPLYGTAKDFTVRDSIEINLQDGYENLVNVAFRLTTDNSIPFDLSLEGTFLDENGNVLADLTEGELIIVKASDVDENGNSINTTATTNDILFEGDRLDLIRSATQLVLTTTFSTTDNGTREVRVTEDQDLRVRLGALLTVDKL